LDGQDPNIFEQVLQYLYTNTYDGRRAAPATSEPPQGATEQKQSSENGAGEAMELDPDDAASNDSDAASDDSDAASDDSDTARDDLGDAASDDSGDSDDSDYAASDDSYNSDNSENSENSENSDNSDDSYASDDSDYAGSDDLFSIGPFDVTDSVLLTHMRVYELAEFLQISRLQELACSKCKEVLWSKPGISKEGDAITKVLTGNCSIELKSLFINTYLESIARLTPELAGYFRDREPLAWSLAQGAKLMSDKVKRIQELEGHLVTLAEEANSTDRCKTKDCPAAWALLEMRAELEDVKGLLLCQTE